MRLALFVAALTLTVLVPRSGSADALDLIANREAIRLGVRLASPPFSYKDERGLPAGLAVRLCQRVARILQTKLDLEKLDIEYIFVNSETRFEALLNEEVDLHCGPMTQTLSRRELLDFSIPYFMDGASAALRRDGVQDVAELSGQPVGALQGTTSVTLATRLAEPAGSIVRQFSSHREGLEALGRGEIDIYFGDHGLLLYQLSVLKAEDRLIPITVAPEQFTYEPYSLAMPAGERRLRLETDRALSQIFLSEVIFTDIQEAFGSFDMSDLAKFIYVLVSLPE
ncbi:MAG: amino acid ABC transporter substrate-binding protein [Pseudomonadota bacterium]